MSARGGVRYETGLNDGPRPHRVLAGFLPADHVCRYETGGESCERSQYGESSYCKLHTDLAWYKKQLVSA
jgi:hypothetical protein